MRHATYLFVAVAFASSLVLAQPEDAGLYLYKIPSSLAEGDPGVLGKTVLADLFVPDPAYLVKQLSENSGLTVVVSTDRYVRVAASTDDTMLREPADRHLAASFVIDHKQPAVATLAKALDAEHGPRPSIDVLVDFVYSTIATKSYRRAFDLASQVAGSREGDCTEHAVLLTALARATNKPARVVLGIILLEQDHNLVSFGHAWTEIHDGRDWQIADATKPSLQISSARIRYLPMLELRDEGPGYAMQLMELAMIQPARIEQVQTATPGD